MSKFGYLSKADVGKDAVASYTIHQITVNGRTPTLVLRPATVENSAYFNEVLKRPSQARSLRGGKINPAVVRENRADDFRLYPEHVVVGWCDVVASDGSDVDFCKEDVADFLNELPDWIFDEVRGFAGNIENFAGSIDVDTTAGN